MGLVVTSSCKLQEEWLEFDRNWKIDLFVKYVELLFGSGEMGFEESII